MSKNKKMILYIALIAANLLFIWGNSMLPGEVSGEISGGLLAWLKSWISGLGISEHLLRKLGHFSEFACLGFLTAGLFRLLGDTIGNRVSHALLLGLLAACTDETIQRFVEGRGSSLIDVWIDTAGVTTGILVMCILGSLIYDFKEKKK